LVTVFESVLTVFVKAVRDPERDEILVVLVAIFDSFVAVLPESEAIFDVFVIMLVSFTATRHERVAMFPVAVARFEFVMERELMVALICDWRLISASIRAHTSVSRDPESVLTVFVRVARDPERVSIVVLSVVTKPESVARFVFVVTRLLLVVARDPERVT
jgi:hypothetical protein